MRILSLEAENFKRLSVVQIQPTDNVVEITGANAQGKTSVLDAIWVALAGAKNIQSVPIRDGATEAKIRLQLGSRIAGKPNDVECIVTRKIKVDADSKNGYTTSLKVEGGAPGMSPQDYLDSLLSVLTFDPMDFMRMRQDDQFHELRQFVSGVDFEAIDKANEVDYGNRTEANRKLKQVEAALNRIVIPEDAALVRVDDAALLQELMDATAANAKIVERKNRRRDLQSEIDKDSARIAALFTEIDRLTAESDKLVAETLGKTAKLSAAPPLPEPVDLVAIQSKINTSKATNKQMDDRDEKSRLQGIAKTLTAESEALSKSMEDRNAAKNEAIAKSAIPVPGLTLGDKMVLFKSLPLNQASDAEQLRVSAEIAMAKNPKLRVIRIRLGSLIDKAGMSVIAEIAKKRDFDVWIERVDESGKVGFVMEDGHLKNAPVATPVQQTLTTAPVVETSGAFPYGKKAKPSAPVAPTLTPGLDTSDPPPDDLL